MAKQSKKKGKRPFIPEWVGRLPFAPDRKKPVVIRPHMEVSTIYGNIPGQIAVHKYVSTDKLTCGDFIVLSGGYFDPPDIHPGDEFYYILQGISTVFNPQTGEVYQVKEGEGFLIPGGVWHQVFNFGDINVKILGSIAPAIWSKEDRGSEIEYLDKSKFYKPGSRAVKPWPQKGDCSSESGMIHIKSDNSLDLIGGEDYHVLVSLFVNTDRMQVGKMIIPGNSCSEREVHPGDEFVYLLRGKMAVRIGKTVEGKESVSQKTLEIKQGDKLLIPEDIEHQYFSLYDKPAIALFSIAPGKTRSR